jgi:hypothetical protein
VWEPGLSSTGFGTQCRGMRRVPAGERSVWLGTGQPEAAKLRSRLAVARVRGGGLRGHLPGAGGGRAEMETQGVERDAVGLRLQRGLLPLCNSPLLREGAGGVEGAWRNPGWRAWDLARSAGECEGCLQAGAIWSSGRVGGKHRSCEAGLRWHGGRAFCTSVPPAERLEILIEGEESGEEGVVGGGKGCGGWGGSGGHAPGDRSAEG